MSSYDTNLALGFHVYSKLHRLGADTPRSMVGWMGQVTGGQMRSKLAWSIYVLSCTVTIACSSLFAQASNPTGVSGISEPNVHSCDSFKNPISGESIAEASRRMRAWKECDENNERVVSERVIKRLEFENGHLVVGALSPEFERDSSILIHHLDIYALNRSALTHQFTLALRCGAWSKTVSDTIPPFKDSPANQGLGEPSFSFDVSPACSLNDIALDLSSPDEVKGNPQKSSASVVEGVSDDEMVERLRSLQGSATTKTQGGSGPSISDLQRRVDEACKQQSVGELANGSVSSVGDHMTACAKAYDDLAAALKARGEAQNQARNAALNQPVPSGLLVVRLTGTEGLPFSGNCSCSNRSGTVSKSYDEVVPFQDTMRNVDNVNCSFISKSDFRHELRLEILKDGRVIGESDTDAPYGLVSIARDVN